MMSCSGQFDQLWFSLIVSLCFRVVTLMRVENYIYL